MCHFSSQTLSRSLSLVLIGLTSLFCTGFGGHPPHSSMNTLFLNQFAFTLYTEGASPTANYALSPPSLYSTLAIPYWGGNTSLKRQFQQSLHMPSSEPLFLDSIDFLHALNTSASSILQIHTSVWKDARLSFTPSFLDFLQQTYSISPFSVDFKHRNPSVHQQINRYVSTHTLEQIPQLLSPNTLPLNTQLFLLNTLYFKADWESPFRSEATYTSPFYQTPSISITANMMVQNNSFLYYETPHFQAVQCDYDTSPFSMLFVLPKAALSSSLKTLSPDFISQFQTAAKREPCVLHLPRFKTRSRLSLKQSLNKLGMSALFRSDIVYPYISDLPLPLFNLFHQVVIDIDESGTTAAAATGGVISTTSFNPNKKIMIFNKPFLYFLIHRPSQLILVMGQVYQPS